MLLEFGVLIACANGYCSPVSSAYFAQYPEVKQQFKNAEDQLIKMTPVEVKTISPVVGLAFSKESVFKFGNNNYVSISVTDPAIKFIWNF